MAWAFADERPFSVPPPPTPGLDVEGLAKAMLRAGFDQYRPADEKWVSANDAARDIAREYVNLVEGPKP